MFAQMFRGEVLEKTLHYYLLAPVRREVLALGKYTAGLVASIVLFGSSTIATYLLMFLASPSGSAFAFSAEGMAHLARYLAVVMLACLGYGAIFLLFGIFFKNPAGVTAALLLWESLSSLLPPALQKLSVVYYLQSLYPVVTSRGAFAIVAEAPTCIHRDSRLDPFYAGRACRCRLEDSSNGSHLQRRLDFDATMQTRWQNAQERLSSRFH